MIDLHLHTTASDGELSPKEVVDLAIEKNLKAIAITDHDVIDGVQEAIDYAKSKNLKVYSGIEITCDDHENGFIEVHILGLFIDIKNEDMVKFSENTKKERILQKKLIIEKLRELGFDISFEEVFKKVGASFGRPHIAKVLMEKYPEEFSSIGEAFEKYLGVGKPAFFERQNKMGIPETIDLIKKSGGLAFLAHPGIYKKEDSLQLIKTFKKFGGDGIETYYPYHLICLDLNIDESQNLQMIKFYQNIANSMGFLESGGSDFHGGKRDTIGKINIPFELVCSQVTYVTSLIN